MHISQTQPNSQVINLESLMLHMSYKRPHARHFFYFIPYINKTIFIIYVIRCQLTPNFASSFNLIIAKPKMNLRNNMPNGFNFDP